MDLLKSISQARAKYAMSDLNDASLSIAVGKENLSEGGIEFLAFQGPYIYFKPIHPQAWTLDEPQGVIENKIYGELKKISEEYGLEFGEGNTGIILSKPNFLSAARVHPHYLQINQCSMKEYGIEYEKHDELLGKIVDAAYSSPLVY